MNIIKKYKPKVFISDGSRKVRCLIKHKPKDAKDEEIVRQSVLKWLIEEYKIKRDRIHIEKNVPFSRKNPGKADIVIYKNSNKTGRPSLLIECKKEDYILDYSAREQAILYSRVLNPLETLLTNGKERVALKKVNGKWVQTNKLNSISNVKFNIKDTLFKNIGTSKKKVLDFIKEQTSLRKMHKREWRNISFTDQICTLGRFLYLEENPFKLPFSYNGLHILEDHGIEHVRFTNASGYEVGGKCRLFLVATSGRVEMLTIGFDFFYFTPYLVVGFIKNERVHAALEMQLKKYLEYDSRAKSISMFHDGKMSRVTYKKDSPVRQSVIEAGREDMIKKKNGSAIIEFGSIPLYKDYNKIKLRKTMANLFHYCLLRTNIREYLAEKRRKDA